MSRTLAQIEEILAGQAEGLLGFDNPKISKDRLTKPGKNTVNEVFSGSDRSKKVIENLERLGNSGRLAGTGYYSILPVDQGIEHSAGASFTKNPDYFDPENIVKLAVEGGCNGVASTLGVLGIVSGKYADKIPFVVKINHNDFFRYPNTYDQTLFASVQQAADMGAAGVGATIYFGSQESARQIIEISEAFAEAHRLGLFTILWCYARNNAFKKDGKDYHVAADITGQANHLGVTIEADIIKQKLPEINGGFAAINKDESWSKFDNSAYAELMSDHPIDLCRWQVMNCYAGKIGLINSGGASGDNDLQDAIATAVINKRAGGAGLISGRKAFQKPLKEGIEILNAIQDVYLCQDIKIA